MFKTVFADYFDVVFNTVKQELAHESTVFAKLIRIQMLYDRERAEVVIGYPLLVDSMYHAMHRDEYRPIFVWWVALFVEVLEKGVEEGLFVSMDPEPVVRSISAIYQGVGLRWFLAPESHPQSWALTILDLAVRGGLTPWLAPGVELPAAP